MNIFEELFSCSFLMIVLFFSNIIRLLITWGFHTVYPDMLTFLPLRSTFQPLCPFVCFVFCFLLHKHRQLNRQCDQDKPTCSNITDCVCAQEGPIQLRTDLDVYTCDFFFFWVWQWTLYELIRSIKQENNYFYFHFPWLFPPPLLSTLLSLCTESRALLMLDKCSTSELYL